ncbi:hypothetical protein NW762_008625 [Fusarium torreyae]|uniref:ARB-07466-like C-terminal domain-containing protein n=1 Tax=Fusarium torreyae TaxID=1237075 RepID=A0A9W8VC29_9HYPO|nr:hypothetical protein NW762_008625 [Fusarium torreyae]
MRCTTPSILLTLFFTPLSLSAPNEPCYGPNGTPGVCITEAACSSAGGTPVSGACPADAANIKCCSKPTCNSGNCRWTSDCAGSSASNQCPGPAQMKCCSAAGSGFGGYPAPTIPAVGACKQVAVDAAKKVVAAWPGRSATLSGKEIAEWCMKNRNTLNLKYVIWGQKIWTTSVDKTEKNWENWRTMEDRGDLTQNHWDHVHVSYNG